MRGTILAIATLYLSVVALVMPTNEKLHLSTGSQISTISALPEALGMNRAVLHPGYATFESPSTAATTGTHISQDDHANSSLLSSRTIDPCVNVPAQNCVIYSTLFNFTGSITVYDNNCNAEGNMEDIPEDQETVFESNLPYHLFLSFENNGALSFHYHDGAWTTDLKTDCESELCASGGTSVVCRKEFFCPAPSPNP